MSNESAPKETALEAHELDRPVPRPIDAALAIVGESRTVAWCSLAPVTDADKQTISKALSNADGAIAEQLNRTLEVRNVLLHKANYLSQDGEFRQGPRLVLMCADGSSYATMGDVPIDSMMSLMQLIGCPPYDPPVKITVVPRTTRNGGKTFTLQYTGAGIKAKK